jgi:hypothetical protein
VRLSAVVLLQVGKLNLVDLAGSERVHITGGRNISLGGAGWWLP